MIKIPHLRWTLWGIKARDKLDNMERCDYFLYQNSVDAGAAQTTRATAIKKFYHLIS